MSDSLQSRIERLEALYSEQDYTLQALNDTIARQQQEISRLSRELSRMRDQLESSTTDIGSEHEKPPHY